MFGREEVQHTKKAIESVFPGGDVNITASREGVHGFKVVVPGVNTKQLTSLAFLAHELDCEVSQKRSGTGICIHISKV